MKSFSGIPEPFSSFLIYAESIQGKSSHTVDEYYYDLTVSASDKKAIGNVLTMYEAMGW